MGELARRSGAVEAGDDVARALRGAGRPRCPRAGLRGRARRTASRSPPRGHELRPVAETVQADLQGARGASSRTRSSQPVHVVAKGGRAMRSQTVTYVLEAPKDEVFRYLSRSRIARSGRRVRASVGGETGDAVVVTRCSTSSCSARGRSGDGRDRHARRAIRGRRSRSSLPASCRCRDDRERISRSRCSRARACAARLGERGVERFVCRAGRESRDAVLVGAVRARASAIGASSLTRRS